MTLKFVIIFGFWGVDSTVLVNIVVVIIVVVITVAVIKVAVNIVIAIRL